ncbi:MAG: type II toxin-antitoxin system RelE/ParE family toxin [Bacteroidetes bacterium]|nr:MAG: type II toxin-antitoxin system RelE/ParE family toxin [Bacteroidota bacterium]
MKIVIGRKFHKDVIKLSSDVQKKVFVLLHEIEKAGDLKKFDVTKIVGYKNYFRIRIGNYRIGYQVAEDGTLLFERVAKRDEIYKIYP